MNKVLDRLGLGRDGLLHRAHRLLGSSALGANAWRTAHCAPVQRRIDGQGDQHEDTKLEQVADG